MAPKKKQEKMALGDFLTNQALGSWADEMDSQPIPSAPAYSSGAGSAFGGGSERRAFSSQQSWGGGADRPARGGMGDRGASYDRPRFSDREQLPLPDKPPYTAHLGNLAFDVTQADITSFLADCEVTSIRIVEDKMDHKPKGFGYVEFGTLEGLKKALTLTDTQFMGRPIRISVAEPPKDRADTRDFSDWSRKGPLPNLPSQGRQPSRGFNRGGNFDDRSDAGSERGGSRRPAFFSEDSKVRDFGNWERKGPLSPAPGAGPPVRDGGRLREGGTPREERSGASWGEGRADAGSRPPRREFQERPAVERAPTAAEQDNQWRSKMRPDPSPAATPDASTPSSPQPQAVKERPRLNLAKRTVSTIDTDVASSGADSKASPFGSARPIDTATREREVDEKRQVAIREKKDADDKAKAEKASRDAAPKSRGPAQDGAEKVTSPSNESGPRRGSRQPNGTKAKENGDAAPQKDRPSFSILKRDAGEEEGDSEADMPDASANGNIIGDKETKPQEIVQEVSKDGEGGEATAEALEADGWSTVPQKAKNSRRGGARALAS
ncbi:hypothetical protein AMS68_000877 [Peltaster fructicola]|uniref:RRM domain-containing protein n=1 Tax=Peltaster fructicola TaxID=286661 RepID=A0A6H0XLH6_9PEZI|nr:hypothetical protein AMS68_000877 [Peltaster fructicola]